MSSILEAARVQFLRVIAEFGSDPYGLVRHVEEVEKWAKYMLRRYAKADSEVVLLGVWLHDIGHYPIKTCRDHAVRGQKRAKAFLRKIHYPKERIPCVLHCIRAHRSRDVLPTSLEAKLLVFADSASHMTDSIYFDMAKKDKERRRKFRAYAKLNRDVMDISVFPRVQSKLRRLHVAWMGLLRAYEKTHLP